MSLIERAIEKVRAASVAAGRRAGDESAPAAGRVTPPPAAPNAPPLPRVAASPGLKISTQMLEQTGLRAPPKFLHQQTAEYRHVKQQLLGIMHAQEGEARRIILVTSALSGDGKTHSAFNLALSLAMEPDFTVLLVDGDVIKPKLSRMFGLDSRPGLMDALSSADSNPESMVVTTNIEGLSFLPAGARNENATEFFASARMQEVLAALVRPANRIIIVDTLPLLLATEARALLQHAGQVVVVVRADVTPRDAVQQALELIPEPTEVSLLLNAADRDLLGSHRYTGYNYSYTYGQEEQSD